MSKTLQQLNLFIVWVIMENLIVLWWQIQEPTFFQGLVIDYLLERLNLERVEESIILQVKTVREENLLLRIIPNKKMIKKWMLEWAITSLQKVLQEINYWKFKRFRKRKMKKEIIINKAIIQSSNKNGDSNLTLMRMKMKIKAIAQPRLIKKSLLSRIIGIRVRKMRCLTYQRKNSMSSINELIIIILSFEFL
jgi:hypothetical protein